MNPNSVKFSLPCSSREECLEVAEALTGIKGVKAPLIKQRIKRNSVEVVIAGSSADVAQTRRLIVRTYSEVKRKLAQQVCGSVKMSEVIKAVGKPLMSQALVEVLRLKGFNVEFSEGILKGGFSWSDLIDTANTLADLLHKLDLKYPKAPQSLKCFVTAYAALKKLDIEDSIGVLKQLNCIIETEEGLQVSGEWRSLLRECLTR